MLMVLGVKKMMLWNDGDDKDVPYDDYHRAQDEGASSGGEAEATGPQHCHHAPVWNN